MKTILMIAASFMLAGIAHGAPVVYTDEALFLADLTALGHTAIHESFEDDTVWADSRNSIVIPGSTPTVTSKGIVWTSNYPQNNIATGTVGGSAPDGTYAIYSLPHGLTTDSGIYCDNDPDPIPIECFQNDGLKVASHTADLLYAFGGRIDTANSGKITFLLDGVDINGNDTDNIDNWQREGELADNWVFIGVIDPDGFYTAELKELKGKDFQQVHMFCDDFTIGTATQVPPAIPDIKANNSDTPITISGIDNLSITIHLDSTNPIGEDADWWILTETPVGWYYFDLINGWSPGIIFTYQAPLFDLTSYKVMNRSGLPTGLYTFYFGVDMIMNGTRDMDQMYYDSVDVTIE
ncbi:hypothetical protein ACFL6N_01025 [Thermodesulfobacteriota bacterium]